MPMNIMRAVSLVEARQCSFNESNATWEKHSFIDGECYRCERGLWSLLHMYGIDVSGEVS